jgi:hypothetical protein
MNTLAKCKFSQFFAFKVLSSLQINLQLKLSPLGAKKRFHVTHIRILRK